MGGAGAGAARPRGEGLGLEEGTRAWERGPGPGGAQGLLWPRAGSEVVRRGAVLGPGCRWAGGSAGSLQEGDLCSSALGLWALGGWGGSACCVSAGRCWGGV